MFQNITMSSQTLAFTLASFPSKYCDNMTLEVAKASEEIRTGTQLKCGVCLHLLMEQVAGASWSPAALISVKIGFCRLAQLSLCRCVVFCDRGHLLLLLLYSTDLQIVAARLSS